MSMTREEKEIVKRENEEFLRRYKRLLDKNEKELKDKDKDKEANRR